MKRNVMKHLSLLLAVLMLVTSAGFNMFAFAENGCTHTNNIDTNNPNYYKVVNPTCEEEGYTVYYCVFCKQQGKTVEVKRGNYYDALGHTLDNGHFEENESGNYRKYFECTRTYNGYDGCNFRANEQDDNGNEIVYHKVEFLNNRIVKDYKTVNGAELADTFVSEAEELKSYYVKSGDAVIYDGSTPYLGKTVTFGQHKHIGWTENANLEVKAQDEYAEGTIVSLENISKNMTLYPVFAGQKVFYNVTFYSNDSQLTNAQSIEHGTAPKFSDPLGNLYSEPEKREDIYNYYAFAGWSHRLNADKGIINAKIEETPVYQTTNYYPVYDAVAKNYTVEFYKYDKSIIETFDGVHLGENLLAVDEISALNNDVLLSKPSNKTYTYEWTGKWRILTPDGELGSIVDLGNFKVTKYDFFELKDQNGVTDTSKRIIREAVTENGKEIVSEISVMEPTKIIRLVPDYYERLIVYNVGIIMVPPADEDQYYYLGDAAVRVFDYNNQLVASGKTDAEGKFRCKLNYKENMPYTVKITTADSKYLGESKIKASFQKDPQGNAETEAMYLNACRVNLTRNPEYETHCSCIHHNALLLPIWVRILNILYTFFNVRYECCYDMYSTIGPLLDYTKEG